MLDLKLSKKWSTFLSGNVFELFFFRFCYVLCFEVVMFFSPGQFLSNIFLFKKNKTIFLFIITFSRFLGEFLYKLKLSVNLCQQIEHGVLSLRSLEIVCSIYLDTYDHYVLLNRSSNYKKKKREKDKNSTKSSFYFQTSTQGQKSQK